MKLHIIVTVYNKIMTLKRLLPDLLLQTNQNFDVHVIQDGTVPDGIAEYISSLRDPRITFTQTKEVNGHFGFPNRDMMLKKIKGEPNDYVLITNDDNQYIIIFVDTFLRNCGENTGFIFCDMLHSDFNYGVLHTSIRVGYIDMGSFVVRLDVAKKVGFSQVNEVADGIYAVECAEECKRRGLDIFKINQVLFIHN